MAQNIDVDPNLVNQALKNMLGEANGQVAMLQAAVTQLQTQLTDVQLELAQLKGKNQELMAASGRQDGVS